MADASDGRKEQRTPVTSERSDRFSGFRDALERRIGEARLRTLEHYVPEAQVPYVTQGGRRFLNFCSNDYLGLAMEPDVVAGAVRAAQEHGTGSGGSRLVVGGFDLHERLEVELAAFTSRPSSLLFNSGFQANTSIIPAVTDRESLVVSDVDSHASIRRGCRLSRARLERFRHNDPDHLDGEGLQLENQIARRIGAFVSSRMGRQGLPVERRPRDRHAVHALLRRKQR